MLNDATGFSRIFLKLGYTDLRKGIPRLTISPNKRITELPRKPDYLL